MGSHQQNFSSFRYKNHMCSTNRTSWFAFNHALFSIWVEFKRVWVKLNSSRESSIDMTYIIEFWVKLISQVEVCSYLCLLCLIWVEFLCEQNQTKHQANMISIKLLKPLTTFYLKEDELIMTHTAQIHINFTLNMINQ